MLNFRASLFLLLVTACSSPSGLEDPVEIRVANESSASFTQVIVRFPSQEEQYGPVAAGALSEYRSVESAYRYARVEAHLPGKTLVLQPIDFVGESLLEPGRYTYVLTLNDSGTELTLSLRRDS